MNSTNYMDLKQQINSEIKRWNRTKNQREEAFGYYVEDCGYAHALACHAGELIQLELICETLSNLQETLTVIDDNLDAVNAHLTMLQDRCLMEILAPADKHGNDANRFVDRALLCPYCASLIRDNMACNELTGKRKRHYEQFVYVYLGLPIFTACRILYHIILYHVNSTLKLSASFR